MEAYMTPTIFLSLSFVDEAFVRTVYDRLPRGVARYYQRAFERGEDLVDAMERNLDDSEVFVLFASRTSLKSLAVNFEVEEARIRAIFGKMKRVFVFPIEPGLTFSDLPKWLQLSWHPNVGESPSDIARFLTTVLLEPDRGISVAAPQVVGRGATVDAARRVAAQHLQRHRASPNVFIFPGISGIGRRTFAAYYLRQGLGVDVNLPYGPSIQLSTQAELIDIYRALRTEVNPNISAPQMAMDQSAFHDLSQDEQIAEVFRIMRHFGNLHQAVTLVTAAGLFEDVASPKDWVAPLLKAVPTEQVLIIVSNIQFRNEFVDSLGNAIQMRIGELDSDDIRTLMIFTANLLDVNDFKISDRLVQAIGGHPDIANAAVRLAKQRGTGILERDPGQLFSVQQTILGDSVRPEALNATSRQILDVLGWLPALGSDLLEKIVVDELGVEQTDFSSTIENLILGCLIYANGPRLAIANSVRQIYRRYNVADNNTVSAMGRVFKAAWEKAEGGGFRDDLFAAFVFMHFLDGLALPKELKALLTPSNLHDVVRDVYARGKQTENDATIKQAIHWGAVASEMQMTEGLREEILSIVARAQIRLRHYTDATNTIEDMKKRRYRQVTFLEGHLLRKQRNFEDAIPKLRLALEHRRGNRAAVHELAICYRRLHRSKDLEALLKDNAGIIDDSAQFLDFMIGLSIARNDLKPVPLSIIRLRQLDDSPNRADLRHAQFLSRQNNDKGAFDFLTDILNTSSDSMRLRKARAVYATRIGNIKEARQDLALITAGQKSDAVGASIETQILLAEGRAKDAFDLNSKTNPQEPGDWLVRAAVFEAVADSPSTTLPERADLKQRAQELRVKYGHEPDYDDEE